MNNAFEEITNTPVRLKTHRSFDSVGTNSIRSLREEDEDDGENVQMENINHNSAVKTKKVAPKQSPPIERVPNKVIAKEELPLINVTQGQTSSAAATSTPKVVSADAISANKKIASRRKPDEVDALRMTLTDHPHWTRLRDALFRICDLIRRDDIEGEALVRLSGALGIHVNSAKSQLALAACTCVEEACRVSSKSSKVSKEEFAQFSRELVGPMCDLATNLSTGCKTAQDVGVRCLRYLYLATNMLDLNLVLGQDSIGSSKNIVGRRTAANLVYALTCASSDTDNPQRDNALADAVSRFFVDSDPDTRFVARRSLAALASRKSSKWIEERILLRLRDRVAEDQVHYLKQFAKEFPESGRLLGLETPRPLPSSAMKLPPSSSEHFRLMREQDELEVEELEDIPMEVGEQLIEDTASQQFGTPKQSPVIVGLTTRLNDIESIPETPSAKPRVAFEVDSPFDDMLLQAKFANRNARVVEELKESSPVSPSSSPNDRELLSRKFMHRYASPMGNAESSPLGAQLLQRRMARQHPLPVDFDDNEYALDQDVSADFVTEITQPVKAPTASKLYLGAWMLLAALATITAYVIWSSLSTADGITGHLPSLEAQLIEAREIAALALNRDVFAFVDDPMEAFESDDDANMQQANNVDMQNDELAELQDITLETVVEQVQSITDDDAKATEVPGEVQEVSNTQHTVYQDSVVHVQEYMAEFIAKNQMDDNLGKSFAETADITNVDDGDKVHDELIASKAEAVDQAEQQAVTEIEQKQQAVTPKVHIQEASTSVAAAPGNDDDSATMMIPFVLLILVAYVFRPTSTTNDGEVEEAVGSYDQAVDFSESTIKPQTRKRISPPKGRFSAIEVMEDEGHAMMRPVVRSRRVINPETVSVQEVDGANAGVTVITPRRPRRSSRNKE